MSTSINSKVLERLKNGGVIPAHPLALKEDLTIDEEAQRRLTRYYLSCGVDGIAVGVHTTQFEIRDPRFNCFEKVLSFAAEEVSKAEVDRSFIKVAGICGQTDQAVREAKIAKRLCY